MRISGGRQVLTPRAEPGLPGSCGQLFELSSRNCDVTVVASPASQSPSRVSPPSVCPFAGAVMGPPLIQRRKGRLREVIPSPGTPAEPCADSGDPE